MPLIGADCKLYINSGTFDTPVWDEVELVRDLQQQLEKGDAEVSHRGSGGWRIRIGTLKDGRLQFDIIWEPGNEEFDALQAGFNGNTLVDLAAMDGDIETPGSQGLRAEMSVLSFSRSEQLDGVVMASVNAAPGSIVNAPEWMVVPSS